MAGDNEEPNIKCVGKLLEIPVLCSITTNVGKIYVDVKNFNFLTNFGLKVVETGAGIVLNTANTVSRKTPINIPVTLADNLVCIVLEEVKVKVPVVYSTPEQLTETSKQLVLGNVVAQNVLGVLEYGCRFSEAVLNILPEQPSNDAFPNEAKSSSFLWSDHYYIVFKPATYVKGTLRKFKKDLRCLRHNYGQKTSNHPMSPDLADKVKDHKQNAADQVGWFQTLLSVPKKALEILTTATNEYSKLNVDQDTLIVDQSPVKSSSPNERSGSCSSDDRKRKHEGVDSDSGEELVLGTMDDICNAYNSEDDPTFMSPTEDASTDSLEYADSGSEETELPIKDLELLPPEYNIKSNKFSFDLPPAPTEKSQNEEAVIAPKSQTDNLPTTDSKKQPAIEVKKATTPKKNSATPNTTEKTKEALNTPKKKKEANSPEKTKEALNSPKKKKEAFNTPEKKKKETLETKKEALNTPQKKEAQGTKKEAQGTKKGASDKTVATQQPASLAGPEKSEAEKCVPVPHLKEKLEQVEKPKNKSRSSSIPKRVPVEQVGASGEKLRTESPRKGKQGRGKSPRKKSSPEHQKVASSDPKTTASSPDRQKNVSPDQAKTASAGAKKGPSPPEQSKKQNKKNGGKQRHAADEKRTNDGKNKA